MPAVAVALVVALTVTLGDATLGVSTAVEAG
jgi:hypothetical protein